MTAVAPASAITSRPSRNGKNASLAATEPVNDSPACWALIAAILVESMRLICPAPTPSVMPYRQNTIALDFTYLATRKAKMRSFISSSVGLRLVTTRNSDKSKSSAVCTSRPPPTRFISNLFSSRASGICSTRTFCLALKTCRAAALNDGANTTSTNCFDTSSAVAPSTSRLNAMIPPNADVGSVSSAR